MFYQWIPIIFIIIMVVFAVKLINRSNQKELEEWNKNNKKKFETYNDLKQHIREEDSKVRDAKYYQKLAELEEKEDKRIKEKQAKEQVVKLKKESFTKTIFSGGSSLTGNIARLNKLYKNGTLTKAEFEKAKNNLLK